MIQQIIETHSGKIEGHIRDGMLEFLGIPYAQPPIGELRFKRALPIKPWSGVFEAKQYGPVAPQFDRGEMRGEEDCLSLNIQRPLEGEHLPVFVWIHGGGFNTGSASDGIYDGQAFAKKGILFVSIQYRLNVLGFYDFTMYEEAEGFESNCGISDHIEALRWIHENIAFFGGDPKKVTIAGESAGGTAVTNLMAIPAVKGMFQQVIAGSAIPRGVFTKKHAKINMDLYLEGMGWQSSDLNRLHTIHPYDMQKGNTYIAEHFQERNPGIYLPSPVVDELIPLKPIEAIERGSASGVKLMIGTNLHEGSMFVRKENTVFPNSWEMIEEMFAKNGQQEAFHRIKEYYEKGGHEDFNGMDEAFINFATDYAFQVPAMQVAEAQKSFGEVYMYRFELVTDFGRKSGTKVSHAYELPLVFANKDFGFSKVILEGMTEEEVERAIESIHGPWVNFIKTGNPGVEGWTPYEGPCSNTYIVDEKSHIQKLDRSQLLKVWDQLRFYE